MKRNIATVLCFISLQSCDCVQQTYGVVVDEKSLQPLDSVVFNKAGQIPDELDRTQADGSFTMYAVSGGLWGCPPIELKFYKPGYEELVLKMEYKHWTYGDSIHYEAGDTIKLKRKAE